MPTEKMNRTTRQKVQILEYMQERADEHIRAEDMLHDLNAAGEPVSKATVYRFLKALEEEGQIRRYTPGDKAPACYQYIGNHPECHQHYHLMCSRCGEIMHVNSAEIQKFTKDMYEKNGFCIDTGKTVFYGTCKNCRKLQETMEDIDMTTNNKATDERKEDQ